VHAIGHVSPEAAEGGLIALVEEGDIVDIDIPARSLQLKVDDQILQQRRAALESAGAGAFRLCQTVCAARHERFDRCGL